MCTQTSKRTHTHTLSERKRERETGTQPILSLQRKKTLTIQKTVKTARLYEKHDDDDDTSNSAPTKTITKITCFDVFT